VDSIVFRELEDVVTYLFKPHKMLGLIKQDSKGHLDNAAYYLEISGSTA
jgi:hypothetical protein